MGSVEFSEADERRWKWVAYIVKHREMKRYIDRVVNTFAGRYAPTCCGKKMLMVSPRMHLQCSVCLKEGMSLMAFRKRVQSRCLRSGKLVEEDFDFPSPPNVPLY